METFGPWIPPFSIVQNGTVVFGPTLYTPVNTPPALPPWDPIPLGPHIKEMIYRGINANNVPATAMITETGDVMITEDNSIMVTE